MFEASGDSGRGVVEVGEEPVELARLAEMESLAMGDAELAKQGHGLGVADVLGDRLRPEAACDAHD